MTDTSRITVAAMAAGADPLPGLIAIWVIVDLAVIVIVVLVARSRRPK